MKIRATIIFEESQDFQPQTSDPIREYTYELMADVDQVANDNAWQIKKVEVEEVT